MSATSADFIERLKRGDRDAFNEVVRQHHGSLYRLVRRLLGDRDDAQDVVQETFLAAFQGISGFEGRSALSTWVLAIGYRKAMDRLRRAHNDPWQLEGDLQNSPIWERVGLVAQITDGSPTPEDNAHRAEIRQALREILAKVPAASRAVFELRDMQGFTSRETALALGMTEGAARVRLHRVRQLLAAEMRIRLQDPRLTERRSDEGTSE
ncbi:MAG: sigma-70 family RNA polymerase sigma factor [Candidatus Lambdaproteobacteria bacterium]|nr:sigma-70 family RNA polymerase sigma factor [Candidatus Lambdaproteobacteria bacterium]